jgi:hypothetical protein
VGWVRGLWIHKGRGPLLGVACARRGLFEGERGLSCDVLKWIGDCVYLNNIKRSCIHLCF